MLISGIGLFSYNFRLGGYQVPKGLGLLHSVDLRDSSHLMGAHLKSVEVLPDYRVWEIGEILDQGEEGTCVGHGWAAWHNCKPKGNVNQVDHSYALSWYDAATLIDEWPDNDLDREAGTSVRAGARVGVERSLLDEYVWASGLDEINAWLLGKGPLVLGVRWWRSLDDPTPDGFLRVDPDSGTRGGHCLLCHGIGSEGNYHLQQSWGYDYVDEGTARMRPVDMQRWISGGGFVAAAGVQTSVAT